MKPTDTKTQPQQRRKVPLIHYGEAITNDEAYKQLLQEEKRGSLQRREVVVPARIEEFLPTKTTASSVARSLRKGRRTFALAVIIVMPTGNGFTVIVQS